MLSDTPGIEILSSQFSIPVRVYYEDTDAGGVVYYANYLRFFERARTEWLYSLGLDQKALMERERRVFVVVSADIRYVKPARFADELYISAEISNHSRTTATFNQLVLRDNPEGELLCEGKIRVACINAVSFRPRPLPDLIVSECGH